MMKSVMQRFRMVARLRVARHFNDQTQTDAEDDVIRKKIITASILHIKNEGKIRSFKGSPTEPSAEPATT